jgi:hypothetical protein
VKAMPPTSLPVFKCRGLGDNAPLAQVGHQAVQAAKLGDSYGRWRTRSASAGLTVIFRSLVS